MIRFAAIVAIVLGSLLPPRRLRRRANWPRRSQHSSR